MDFASFALFFFLLLTFEGLQRQSLGCTSYNPNPMSMEEVLYNAQIVLYGRDIKRYEVQDTAGYTRTDSHFEVFCVFKKYGPIFRNITIQRLKPRDCSGTKYAVGEPVVLGLKRIGNGNFEWHELNIMQTSAFTANDSVLQRVVNICGLGTVKLPFSRGKFEDPRCPRSKTSERYCTTGGAGSNIKGQSFELWVLHVCTAIIMIFEFIAYGSSNDKVSFKNI